MEGFEPRAAAPEEGAKVSSLAKREANPSLSLHFFNIFCILYVIRKERWMSGLNQRFTKPSAFN